MEIRFNLLSEEEYPDYVVNLQNYAEIDLKKNQLIARQKISHTVLEIFKWLTIVTRAFNQALSETIKNSPTYFKEALKSSLSSTLDNSSLERVIQGIFFSLFGVAFNLVKRTVLLVQKERNPRPLDPFADLLETGIQMEHFRSNEMELDTKNLKPETQVDLLLDFFDAINLDDPLKPCYVRQEELRLEGNQTKEDLRESLELFISRIKKRVPFLGTPPAYEIHLLHTFYQQLEDTVRLSIQHINEGLDAFYKENGKETETYDEKQKAEHSDWISRRTSLAIDLAHAGNFCGTRYIGEATNHYCSLKGKIDSDNYTLEGHLIHVLALKRKEIALKQISAFSRGGLNVHFYNKYMERMGKILGIPGTENIVEHLLTDNFFDVRKHLEDFFKIYNVNCIIDTIQEEVKTSEKLREKIILWLKDQRGDWNKENDDVIPLLMHKIQEIIQENEEPLTDFSQKLSKDFFSLLQEMKENKVRLDGHWNHCVYNYIFRDDADPWNKKFSSDKFDFLAIFTQENLEEDCINHIHSFLKQEDQQRPINLEEKIIVLLKEKEKIKKIHPLLPTISKDTIKRILKNQNNLQTVIENALDNNKTSEFLDLFQLEEITTSGLSDKLMEWLLVSQKIFLPQTTCQNDQ